MDQGYTPDSAGLGGGYVPNQTPGTNGVDTQPRNQGTEQQGQAPTHTDINDTAQGVTIAAVNYAADFSDGTISLSANKIVEGNFKEATGEFIAEGTYRQQNDVHDGIRKIENAAAWLTLASGNYIQSEEAYQYKEFIANGGEQFMIDHGLSTNQALVRFEQASGIHGLSLDQIGCVAKNGFYFQPAVNFSEQDMSAINNYLADPSSVDFNSVTRVLGNKNISVNDQTFLPTLSKISQCGGMNYTHRESVTNAQQVMAQNAVSEQKAYDALFKGGSKKAKADAMGLIRERVIQDIGIKEFTGTKSQIKDLEKPFHETHVVDGKMVTKEFYGFRNRSGELVRVTAAERDKIVQNMGMVGASKGTSRANQVKSGKLKQMATSVMDEDAKTGMNFSVATVKVTAKTAGAAYRAATMSVENAKLLAHGVASASVGIASVGVGAAGKLGMNVTGAKASLQEAKGAIKNSKGVVLHDKQAKKDILKARKEVSRAKRTGDKASVAKAKSNRDSLIAERKEELATRRETRLNSKGDSPSPRSKKAEERRERQHNKHEKKARRQDSRKRRRTERLNKLKEKRPIAAILSVGNNVKNSRVLKVTGKIGRGFGKVVSAPIKLYNKIFDFFAELKKKLIKLIGIAGLHFLGLYMILCVVIVVVGVIASFFSFLFKDDTNYGQLLVSDMRELQDGFLEMARNDGATHYKEIQANPTDSYAAPQVIYSTQYGDGTLIISDVADQAKIQDYHVTYTGNFDMKDSSADGLGSVIPYFGIMHYKYLGEIGGDQYGLAKAQMYDLWVRNNRVLPKSYSYTLDFHTNLAECGCVYEHGETEGKNNPPKDTLGTCNNYTTTPKEGKNICTHRCMEGACYHFETQLVCTNTEDDHAHDSSCNQSVCVSHCCHRRCAPWKSESNPGCYETIYINTCDGHCPGIIVPEVDIYYAETVSGILKQDFATESYKMGMAHYVADGWSSNHVKFTSFHPSSYIGDNVASLSNLDRDAMLRFDKSLIKAYKDAPSWYNEWRTLFLDMNANWDASGRNISLPNEWSIKEAGGLTPLKYQLSKDDIILTGALNINKNETAVINAYSDSYFQLEPSDIEFIESMIGTYEDGYVDGAKMWKEFGVYFTGSTLDQFENKPDIEKFLTEQYGIDLDSSDRSGMILRASIAMMGKYVSYDDDLSSSENNLTFINKVMFSANGFDYPPFSFYEKKAKATNESLGWFGLANEYKDLAPGSILVDPVNQKLAIYLGMDGSKGYRVLDCVYDNQSAGVHTLGWDEIETRYSKTISAADIDADEDWVKDAQKAANKAK